MLVRGHTLFLCQFHTKVGVVKIILRHAEISPCNFIIAVIINIHNDDRGYGAACPGIMRKKDLTFSCGCTIRRKISIHLYNLSL